MNQALHILVEGKVQGVGFRKFTRQAARDHQITGWVRNLEDGKVECVAEGKEDDLDNFLHQISLGPIGSQVVNLKKISVENAGFQSFEILIP